MKCIVCVRVGVLDALKNSFRITAFGDNLVSLRRNWTKLRGNYSHNPPGTSYVAQGPQKQPEISKHLLFRNYKQVKHESLEFNVIPFKWIT